MRRAVLLLSTMAGTMLLVVTMGLVPAQPIADAQSEVEGLKGPTLQFGCDVVKVAAEDPILDPEHPHDHIFYGNKGVDADSTYASLVANKDTTCSLDFATSSYWNPVVRMEKRSTRQRGSLSTTLARMIRARYSPYLMGYSLLAKRKTAR